MIHMAGWSNFVFQGLWFKYVRVGSIDMCWFEGCNEVKVSSRVPTWDVSSPPAYPASQTSSHSSVHMSKAPCGQAVTHLLNVPCMSGTVITGEIKEQCGTAPILEELVLVKCQKPNNIHNILNIAFAKLCTKYYKRKKTNKYKV